MHNLFAGARAGVLLGLFALLAAAGCNLINPDEAVPAYLSIARPTYTPGSGDPNVVSALVYVEDLFIGIFDVPAKVPVLHQGNVSVRVAPVIYPDGQRATRVVYPFYTDLKTRVNLVPGEVLRLTPTLAYNPATTQLPFDIDENFSTTLPAFSLQNPASSPSLYNLEAGVDDAERPQVGRVGGVAGRTDAFFLQSIWSGKLPDRAAPVYLELDYRSTMPFQVGLKYGATYTGDLTAYPSAHWTKLYVNLSEEIGRVNNSATIFNVYLEGLPTGAAGDFFAVDNIRLVRP